MACCSLVQCSRRARHAAKARLAEAAGYQAAAQWFQMARTRQKSLSKVISRVFTSKFQQNSHNFRFRFAQSDFTSFHKQVSANSHNFRFRFTHTSYSLQAQVLDDKYVSELF